jgi:LDH2 family malate/lactate/ureidoglycolate dehydrogenase
MTIGQAAQFSASSVRAFCERALVAVGASTEAADVTAAALVDADLRGADGQGLALLPLYTARAKAGGIDPRAVPTIVSDLGAVVVVDGRAGFGQVAAVRAMRFAIERALRHGIGTAAVRNSNHLGALAYYARMATDQSAIGIAISGGVARIAPAGGATPMLSTAPWSFAFPTRPVPVVFDSSNAEASFHEVEAAASAGLRLGADWALDDEGRPTTDPSAAVSLQASGGAKGAARVLALDLLSSLLSGAKYAGDVGDPHEFARPQGLGHLFIALRVDHFAPLAEFQDRCEGFLKAMMGSRPVAGGGAPRMPGERGAKIAAERTSMGIPISTGVRADLDRLARDLDVAPLVPE